MNKYYTALQEVQDDHQFKGEDWFDQRQQLIKEYGPVVPSEEALVYLSEFNSIDKVETRDECWTSEIQSHEGEVTTHDTRYERYDWVNEQSVILKVGARKSPVFQSGLITQRPAHLLFAGTDTRIDEAWDYSLIAKIGLPSFEGLNHSLLHFVRNP